MEFALNHEQIALQNAVREFVAREIEPLSADMEASNRLPDHLIKKMAELGLMGMTLPERYGGAGSDMFSCILACEELARSGTPAWWLVAFNNSIPDTLYHYGNDFIKETYLPPLCRGDAYASIQFTEADTGSDPAALTTRLVRDGQDLLLSGSKRFSTFGARDGVAMVFARDENNNCTAVVVPKNIRGYSIASAPWSLMGSGGVEAVDVYFDNVRVESQNVLGKEGQGFEVLLYWIATEKIQQCAACVGIAQAALDEAINYINNRVIRGKPVSEMQGIRWMVAEMYARIQSARLITYRAATLKDKEDRGWKEEAAAAKIFVVPTATQIVQDCFRLHGAYGYTRDFKIERLYRAVAGASVIATSLEINKSIVGGWIISRSRQ